MALTLTIGQATDPGRVRQSNEDSLCVLQPPSIASDIDALVVVADGMGGHNAGEIASGFVTEKLGELFRSPDYRKWVDFSPEREDYYVLVLKEILEKLNDQLHQMASRREEWRGMGTTVTAGLIAGSKVYLGHVGDSRAYLFSQNSLRQLTKDHAWVMEQVAQGLLSPEQAAAHPRKNEITRALGISSLVRVDRYIRDLMAGDALLLCTDGLTNLVSDNEMQHHLQSIADPQHCCQTLVNLANQRGGGDNITVVVTRVQESPDERVVIAPPPNPSAGEGKVDTEEIVMPPRRRWQKNKPKVSPPTFSESTGSSVPTATPELATDGAIPATAIPPPAIVVEPRQPTLARQKLPSSWLLFTIGFLLMGYVFFTALGNVWIASVVGWGSDNWVSLLIIGAATWVWVVLGLLLALASFFFLFNRR